MQLFCIVRGHKEKVDRWVNDILAQYTPFRHKKDSKDPALLQVAVRPIQLLEIAFPEDQLEEILRMVRPYDKRGGKIAGLIRRAMRLDKIPKRKYEEPYRIFAPFVSVTGVGLKKDPFKDGIEQI